MNQNQGPRLPTGMKSQNYRLPTGYQQVTIKYSLKQFAKGQNFGGIGQTTKINVEARPVTKGGIPGMKGLKATGPERQIYNKNYYMILLKKKIDEIQKEIGKFQKQEEDINRDNNLYFQLEKKYEELTKEVRNLEGQLADYNLAFDKLRTKTRPEDIKNMYEYIKIQNDKHRMILDDIFIERKKQEDQLNMIERELGDLNKQLEIRIGELDPESRNEYEGLLNENRELTSIMQQQRMELEELQMRLQQYENRLQADTNKLKAKQIREQTQMLERKKDDLEMQLNEANLPFPQARDRLQARIKEDKEQLGIFDKRIKEVQRLCDNYEKQLKEMTQELESEQKGEEKDKQKYEILYQRDKEMTEFIDSYPSNRKNQVEAISTTQQHIVKMLDNISKMLYVVGQLPSLEEYQNIKTDLDSKATAKDNAEITLLKLQAELEKRTADLKKLEQAEERIVTGIEGYTEKISLMENEISTKFDNANNQKQLFEKQKNKMTKDKNELYGIQNKMYEQAKQATQEYNLKEKRLPQHEHFNVFNDYEKRYGQNEQMLYSLKAFIANKQKDMNYIAIQDQCIKLTEMLNQQIVQSMSAF